MTTALFNELDPYASEWLKNLIDAGHIAPGAVESRSICDLTPEDLEGYKQFHAFAGLGIWSYALRLAGVSDETEVYTGSPPCTPFSQAGAKKGFKDERHLWPELFRLIVARRPPIVFLENVSSPDGLKWFKLVCAQLEGARYGVIVVDTCAASSSAPHIRQRLYVAAVREDVLGYAGFTRSGWDAGTVPGPKDKSPREWVRAGRVADVSLSPGTTLSLSLYPESGVADHNEQGREQQRRERLRSDEEASRRDDVDGRGEDGGVAHHHHRLQTSDDGRRTEGATLGCGEDVALADAERVGLGEGRLGEPHGRSEEQLDRHRPTFWSNSDWVYCRDGKYRPVPNEAYRTSHRPAQPSTELLAHEPSDWLDAVCSQDPIPLVRWDEIPEPKPSRTQMLKCFGNGIVASVAVEFIKAVMDTLSGVDND